MYQVPVQKPERIRTSRKRVKEILRDIGLDSCHNLLKELSGLDAGEECFLNTEWEDLTDSYSAAKRRKKWCYRTQSLCCALCWFSTRSWHSYRSHVQRCHDEEVELASLAPCPRCSFISRPALLSHHTRLFHSHMPHSSKTPPVMAATNQVGVRVMQPGVGGDKFSCVRCGFHDSLLYVMRKHVLVSHCDALLKRYYGQRSVSAGNQPANHSAGSDGNQGASASGPEFYCCVCEMPAETSEHLLYHLLSSDKHRDLNSHISPLLVEHCNSTSKNSSTNARLPQLAPRALQQVVSLVSKTTGSSYPPNGKPLPSPGAVLLAPPPQTTALVCSTGGRQILLANQNPAAMATCTGPTPTQAPPINLLLSSGAHGKQLPLSIALSARGHPPPGQVLLPPGVTFNLGGKVGGVGGASQPLLLTQTHGGKLNSSQPLMLTQRFPVQAPPPRTPLIPPQSTVRLVPTGNKVNGLPTYTLATVQLAVPVQPGATTTTLSKPPILVTALPQTSQSQPVAGLNSTTQTNQCSGPALAVGHAKQLLAQSQYLVRTSSGMVRCSRCKVLLSDKGIFQHLLHGLRCLFCPLMFYSLKQLLHHSEVEHSLMEPANRERVRREHRLATKETGALLVPAFNMKTTVPRELLGCNKLQLALITMGRKREVLYLLLSEEQGKPPSPSLPPSGCPFCPSRSPSPAAYEQHLRQRHHILPTIHAILKTPAFKCVYCLGVYTDKSTARTISIHVQRCRCAPRSAKEAERLLNPDTHSLNGTREGSSLSSWGRGRGPAMTFALEPPAGLELRPPEERKYFLGQYFNRKPYPSRKEIEVLAVRLRLARGEVFSLFSSKQSCCVRACVNQPLHVLLGFDTTSLKSLKHPLALPGSQPHSSHPPGVDVLEPAEPSEPDSSEPHQDHLYAETPSTLGHSAEPNRTQIPPQTEEEEPLHSKAPAQNQTHSSDPNLPHPSDLPLPPV